MEKQNTTSNAGKRCFYGSRSDSIKALEHEYATLVTRLEASRKRNVELKERLKTFEKEGYYGMKNIKAMSLKELEEYKEALLKLKGDVGERLNQLSLEKLPKGAAGPSEGL